MSFTVTVTETRPSVDVPFYKFDDETSAYMIATYDDSGKRLYRSKELSTDFLTRTWVSVWLDEAAWMECHDDTVIIGRIQDRRLYNEANGIFLKVETTPY